LKLKRKINLTDPKKIKIIKIIRIKIKIKNKNKILIEGFNWKEKSIQQKKTKKTNQMNENQFEKNNISKIRIEG
jgi:ubiquitin